MDQEEVNVHKNAKKRAISNQTDLGNIPGETGFIIQQKQTYFLQEHCEFRNN